MDPLILMSVLHHHNQTGPALERGEKEKDMVTNAVQRESLYPWKGYIGEYGCIRQAEVSLSLLSVITLVR